VEKRTKGRLRQRKAKPYSGSTAQQMLQFEVVRRRPLRYQAKGLPPQPQGVPGKACEQKAL